MSLFVRYVPLALASGGGGGGSSLSIGTIDSTTPSTDGAVISAGKLIMQSASATDPGLINTAAQSVTGFKTFLAGIASPGTGTNSTAIGSGALASATNTMAVGTNANATASSATAIGVGTYAQASSAFALGYNATATNINSIAVGTSSLANANDAIAFGSGSDAGYANSIAIGSSAVTTAANQVVIGSNTNSNTDLYVGNGVTAAVPANFTLHAPGGSGTDIAGAELILAGGISTGAGAGGSVLVQVTPAGTSGTSPNALSTVVTFAQDLSSTFAGDIAMGSHHITSGPVSFTVLHGDISLSGSSVFTARNQLMFDTTGATSIDWNNRLLVDSAGTTIFDYSTAGAPKFDVPLSMSSQQINNVANPTLAQDAATKAYVDAETVLALPLAGGTMTGAINIGNLVIASNGHLTDSGTNNNTVAINDGSGNILIQADDGGINLNTSTNIVETATGNITLTANGGGGSNLVLNTPNEEVLIESGGDITHTATRNIALTANGGGGSNLVLSTPNGQVLLESGGDIVISPTRFLTLNAGPSSGYVEVASGNLSIVSAGSGLLIAEGSNAKMGTASLLAGTITVGTTAVTANSRIFVTSQVDGGTPGFLRVSNIVAGTSFDIVSSSALDTSTVAWLIVDHT